MTSTRLADAFHELHRQSQILVLPGVWDVASARVFAARGFEALGTTSSGIAWSLGHAAGQDVEWPVFLDVCRRIARAVEIPVSFDLESGFGDSPEVVADHVREAIEAGACGINIEDGFRDGVFADASFHADKIRVIRALCTALDYPLYVNARTDVYLGGLADESRQLAEAISRTQQYIEAGADGVFVPGMLDAAAISTLVKEVPGPVNIYALPGLTSAGQLGEMGVRRVSLGCGPQQSILAGIDEIATAVRLSGEWSSFTDSWMQYPQAVAVCTSPATE